MLDTTLGQLKLFSVALKTKLCQLSLCEFVFCVQRSINKNDPSVCFCQGPLQSLVMCSCWLCVALII